MSHQDPYSHIAPVYDLAVDFWTNTIRREICTMLNTGWVRTVVDLGCGTGRLCSMLRETGFEVYGVDSSAAMLARAERSSSSIKYLQQDITATPFSDHSFHAAVISLVLHEHPGSVQETILDEALRIVTPGGFLVLLDYGDISATAPWVLHYLIHIPERIAGKKHYHNYRAFIKKGGLKGQLRSRDSIETVQEKGFYQNTLWLYLGQKI